MRANLPGARGLIVESLQVGPGELAAGSDLVAVQKYGAMPRNIDVAACAARGIKVLTYRRRANIACAEVAITLMLTLAKKMHRLAGRISPELLAAEGYNYKPFDRRHTPNSNWARIAGVRMLHDSTLGIIGVGEIGREIVLRAAAFGMRILYHQRNRLPEAEERQLQLTYLPSRAVAGRERLGRAAGAGHPGDPPSHRSRAARADEAGRLPGQHLARRPGGSVSPDRGLEIGTARRLRARSAL